MNEARVAPPSPFLELRHASTDRPVMVVVPERRFVVIDGVGRPGAADFRAATNVVRTVHDRIRTTLRHDRFADGPNAILEIAWLADGEPSLQATIRAFKEGRSLRWRQMLELPRAATAAVVEDAIDDTRRRGGRTLPLVRSIAFAEGPSAQLLHVGGMTDLTTTLDKLRAFVEDARLRPHGSLHQLIFGDPDVVPSGRSRSILRIPVEQIDG